MAPSSRGAAQTRCRAVTPATMTHPRPQRQGQLVLRDPAPGAGGQPGDSSRPPLHATATRAAVTAPITDRSPNRAAIAARAAPTAATTSPHPDPVAFGIDTSTPAATATERNQCRTTSARPVITRSQPRTVDPGIPNRAPIRRCPPPAAFDHHRRPDQLRDIGPAQQQRHRQQHVRHQTRPAPRPPRPHRRGRPTTWRERAKPHRTNTPSGHDGHDTSPAANRDSTRSESTSTVTISAFRTTHGAAEGSAKKSAGAPCTHQFLDTLTVQTTKINPTPTPTTTSAASTTTQHPVVVIPRDGQQAARCAACWCAVSSSAAVCSGLPTWRRN